MTRPATRFCAETLELWSSLEMLDAPASDLPVPTLDGVALAGLLLDGADTHAGAADASSSSAVARVVAAGRGAGEATPAAATAGPDPFRLPTGARQRMRWLRSFPVESDAAVSLLALRVVGARDPHDARLGWAVAVLWRTLKPAIEATEVRLVRLYRGMPPDRIAEAIDGAMTDVLARTRADTVAGFVAYGSRAVNHATRELLQDLRFEQQHTRSLGDVRGTEDERGGRYVSLDRVAAHAPNPTTAPSAEAVLRVVRDAIVATTRNARQCRVLEHYFGIGEFDGRGLRSPTTLGEIHDIAPARVQQLVARARSAMFVAVGVSEEPFPRSEPRAALPAVAGTPPHSAVVPGTAPPIGAGIAATHPAVVRAELQAHLAAGGTVREVLGPYVREVHVPTVTAIACTGPRHAIHAQRPDTADVARAAALADELARRVERFGAELVCLPVAGASRR